MNKNLLLPFICCLATACGDNDSSTIEWEWGSGQPQVSADEKSRIVWIDAGGNFERFANSQANIKTDLKLIKDAGFNEIVVDVRPTNGDVLFNSTVGDALTRLDVWTANGYEWVERTAKWDYLQTFIDEGHALGLKVNASINTFVGGYSCPYGLGNDGMVYRDASKKSWAMVLNNANELTNVTDISDPDSYGARFINPANDEVKQYLLTLLKDLAKYDVDGIILDRCRYDDNDLLSDFSAESRAKFEHFIGRKVDNFPNDILLPGTSDLPATCQPMLKRWLSFRAKTIHDFVEEANQCVKSVNADIKFCAYVGGWYSTYYTVGVNWASPRFNCQTISGYQGRVDQDYMEYGYADHVDRLFVGAYASASSIYGQGEWTMQGFALQARQLMMGETKYYCGPDIGNAGGWIDGNQQARIPDAVSVCMNNSDGVFIFDLCHIRKFNYWNAFKTIFNK